ncbi:MAG: hypothetical protein R3E13_00015 [Alphaproteobacteria bacterium]
MTGQKTTFSAGDITILGDEPSILSPTFIETQRDNLVFSTTGGSILHGPDDIYERIEQTLDAEALRLQHMAHLYINSNPLIRQNIYFTKLPFKQESDDTIEGPPHSESWMPRGLLQGTSPPLFYVRAISDTKEKYDHSRVILLTFEDDTIAVRHSLLHGERSLQMDVWEPKLFKNSPDGAKEAIALAQERFVDGTSELRQAAELSKTQVQNQTLTILP